MSTQDYILDQVFLDAANTWDAGASMVGGKAAQLAQLTRYGLPVPVFFSIPAAACKQLFDSTTWQEIWHDTHQACRLEHQERDASLARIRNRITNTPDEPAWLNLLEQFQAQQNWQQTSLAVRSSALGEDGQKHSFAGIHSSELHVKGTAALALAIRKVVASLWTLQACAYREKIGLPHEQAAMSIVVMPMIESAVAGVIFTCDPHSGRADQLRISCVRGLADALVAGTVNGEDLVVQRDWAGEHWKVTQRHLAQGELILDDEAAIRLAKLAIDAAYAFDYSRLFLDIEWVYDGKQFYLVQARPISAKSIYTYPQIADQATLWTNGNTKEILPFPVKISELELMNTAVNEVLGVAHDIIGVPRLEGLQRIALFQGHAYLNASLIQWEIFDAFNMSPDEVSFVLGGHQTNLVVAKHDWHALLKVALNIGKATILFPLHRKRGARDTQKVIAMAKEWQQQDLRQISDADLLTDIFSRSYRTYAKYRDISLMQGASGTLMNLHKMLSKKGAAKKQENEDENEETASAGNLVSAIMSDGERSVSAQQGFDLMALAALARNHAEVLTWLNSDQVALPTAWDKQDAFVIAYQQFLQNYGHRGNYESYLSRASWRDQPHSLKQAILSLTEVDANSIRARQEQQAHAAWQTIRQSYSAPKRLLIHLMQKQAKMECNQRELARSTFAMMLEHLRRLMLELGRRLQERELLADAQQVFHLRFEELRALHTGTLTRAAIQHRILDRMQVLSVWELVTPPDFVEETGMQAHNSGSNKTLGSKKSGKENCWQGIAVSTARYQGRVKRIDDPSQIALLQTGDIMLTATTDPSWLPLFLKAGGIIVETGGYLSHSAIVARELGIPAIVNLPGILDILRDGDEVCIDGAKATLTLFNRKHCEAL